MVIGNSQHKFPKENSCLTKLIYLYNAMINLQNGKSAVDAVCLQIDI